MNRTDRLYALVAELRAVSPRPRSATWLARRFEVSVRTIERDLSALQQSGEPIWAEPGRTGGYCIDRDRTLPPVNFTPSEAVAIAVALRSSAGSPFAQAGNTALRKLVSAMRDADTAQADELASRVHFVGTPGAAAGPGDAVPPAIVEAVTSRRVLRLAYRDGSGNRTRREVEPVGYVGATSGWYLLAWCRLREGIRAFRFDRIEHVTPTAQLSPPRRVTAEEIQVPEGDLRTLALF
ncbi:helix-turn-helix transcriptional regulator [Humibacter ginsenosidimutans]|uniref:YafY family transcriptional regulator n=1 Tax=Humibacter ginsenosidimutans TaxID=2599293 RepID=A0A5B8M5F1_9MICO|nr:YafY family protein [Humibacter ginsenosidimutans]QDZ14812.1 YafY family transcriptional regulator [Humibacter ginsenosidimutans]